MGDKNVRRRMRHMVSNPKVFVPCEISKNIFMRILRYGFLIVFFGDDKKTKKLRERLFACRKEDDDVQKGAVEIVRRQIDRVTLDMSQRLFMR